MVLQAVLLLCKLQPLVIMGIVTYVTPSCDFPLTLQVQKNGKCLPSYEILKLNSHQNLVYNFSRIPNVSLRGNDGALSVGFYAVQNAKQEPTAARETKFDLEMRRLPELLKQILNEPYQHE